VTYLLDIIGDSVYLLYANLYDLTRQTARVPRRDRVRDHRVEFVGLQCERGNYHP
jgi:hypothetical protein